MPITLLQLPRWALAAIAVHSAALFLAGLQWGVDVAYRDDWGAVVETVLASRTAGFWNALLKPHNEHWLPLPKLLYVALSTDRLDFVRLMLASIVIHIASLLLFLTALLRSILPASVGVRQRGLAAVAATAVFSCALQSLNFFMATQIFWTLAALGALVALWGMSERRWTATLIGLAVTALSMPLWLALVPVLFLVGIWDRERLRRDRPHALRFTAVLLSAIGAAALYRSLILSGGDGPTLDPVRLLDFWLRSLGSPLTQSHVGPALRYGIVYVALTTFFAVRRDRASGDFPRLVAVFGALAALLIAVGRHHLPVSYAGGRHYMAFSLPGWASLMVLLYAWGRGRARHWGLAIVAACAVALSAHELADEARRRRPLLASGRSCLAPTPGFTCTPEGRHEVVGELDAAKLQALLDAMRAAALWPR